jgi:pilus assembly protein Flp/PilA
MGMRKVLELAKRFGREEDGAAMIEYSILIGIISAAVILSVLAVGGWVQTQWSNLEAALIS